MNIIKKTLKLPNGKILTVETGHLARQADGAIILKIDNTMLLATVVAEKEAAENIDFLPLSVDYQEKFAASGKIPGGFFRREGKLSDREVLISRLIDRVVRPLFPKDFHAPVQINIYLISSDKDIMPDSLAAFAASCALAVSDIPIIDYVSEARVSRIDGKFVINPNKEENKTADIDLIVGATSDHILMVEGEMNEVSEDEMLEAISFAHEEIKNQCQFQKELTEEAQKQIKREYKHHFEDETLKKLVNDKSYDKIYKIIEQTIVDKKQRNNALSIAKQDCQDLLIKTHQENEINTDAVKNFLNEIVKKASREFLLTKNIRLDGRKPNEIRKISSMVDYLPGAHGSALFTRGETQSLTTITLGGKMDEQLIDSALETSTSKFLLHYNFPGFCTGDVKPNRGPSRREVGHGNLAMRAIKKILPNDEDNPYTIRVVSDILESNGSSSMATVCAASLALMDAGVKVKKHVAGIAMGLVIEDETKYQILSDILGDEDHLGDMDFKVTGTENGITACQMDIKVAGISKEIMHNALIQAKEGRIHILNEMKKTIQSPNQDYKQNVPRIEILEIDEKDIGQLIGPGGKTIQKLQKDTNTVVAIENINKKGIVNISGNINDINDAKETINNLLAKPTIGEVYKGKITSVLDFGAFIEFLPGKSGLLHISEIMWDRVKDIHNILKEGQDIEIKLIDIDPKTGKYKLSKKALIPKPKFDEE